VLQPTDEGELKPRVLGLLPNNWANESRIIERLRTVGVLDSVDSTDVSPGFWTSSSRIRCDVLPVYRTTVT
jgi:hypothetical protein